MDTPERSKIGGTPISKYEDSPLFNFINSLSPIQPVKSVHSIQTFHSPGSATLSSVFSSPHVSFHKESRFIIRHPFPDAVKPEASSVSLDESSLHSEILSGAILSTSIVLAQENCNIICSLNKAVIDPEDENSIQPISHSVQCDSGSPRHSTTPFYDVKLDFKACLVQGVLKDMQASLSTKTDLEVNCPADQMKDDSRGTDWENLISGSADDYYFEQANGLQSGKIKDNEFSLNSQDDASIELFLRDVPCDSVVDDGDAEEGRRKMHTLKLLSSSCQEKEKFDDQHQKTAVELDDNGAYLGLKNRGVRRRCLIFDSAGASKKNSLNKPNAPPSILLPLNTKPTSENGLLSSSKASVPYVVPGIGLHLNALARPSKNGPILQKMKTPGRDFISRPCSVLPSIPSIAEEKQPNKILDFPQCPNRSGGEVQDSQVVLFDAPFIPANVAEESNSPRQKRRRIESSGESEGCRRCNCKKSKCLKLYCECFAAGVYCVEPCSCQGCLNKPFHEEIVLTTRKQIESRNPLAFAPKVIRTSEHDQEMGEENNKTPASARHKRGCNCKKSNCLKKYCECYQGGAGCSFSCRCEGCKNAFGRKDGYEEIEYEEPLEACEKENKKSDDSKAYAYIPKAEFSESILPATTFSVGRTSAKLPFILTGKRPRFSILSLMSISDSQQAEGGNTAQNSIMQNDDDTSEDINANSSPCTAVKTASPNGKRVSLPLGGFGASPNGKGGRKLILKSIPSFPYLGTDVSPKRVPFSSSVLSSGSEKEQLG